MEEIKIGFADFWKGFDPSDNFIVNALKRYYKVRVVEPKERPDILFFSCFGKQEHYRYQTPIRIYFTGENDVPDFNECDYAMSFNRLTFGNRHLQLPLYCVYDENGIMQFDEIAEGRFSGPPNATDKRLLERGFCSVVVSNGSFASSFRGEFFTTLCKYKEIASGGRWRNNIGGPVPVKTDFIKGYKFNLAMENSLVDHYTTEKIVNAYYARTVPIYWGNPEVAEHFNPTTFINLHDFASAEEAVAYIAKVDSDPELYLSYFRESPLSGNPFLGWADDMAAFVGKALSEGKKASLHGRAQRLYNRASLSARLLSLPLMSPLNILLRGRSSDIRL